MDNYNKLTDPREIENRRREINEQAKRLTAPMVEVMRKFHGRSDALHDNNFWGPGAVSSGQGSEKK